MANISLREKKDALLQIHKGKSTAGLMQKHVTGPLRRQVVKGTAPGFSDCVSHQSHKAFLCHCMMLSEAQSRRNYWGIRGSTSGPPGTQAQKARWCKARILEADGLGPDSLPISRLSSSFGFLLGDMGLIMAPASNNCGEDDWNKQMQKHVEQCPAHTWCSMNSSCSY